jgi:hypothetical protein
LPPPRLWPRPAAPASPPPPRPAGSKHHCRGCGLIFCSDCLRTAPLEQFGIDPDAPQSACRGCAAPYVHLPNAPLLPTAGGDLLLEVFNAAAPLAAAWAGVPVPDAELVRTSAGVRLRVPGYDSRDHDLHHEKFSVNYGFPFVFLDLLHGTYEAPPERGEQRGEQRGASSPAPARPRHSAKRFFIARVGARVRRGSANLRVSA